jgi:DNA-binding GntR family transcriptional regulator
MAAESTLAENVADALRHAILHGAYVCGERLVELTIAREMNVSQNTVRDALRLLEQAGLVVKRARVGTQVRTYSDEEAAEIYTLWAALESLILHWVVERITPAQLADMRALLDQFRLHPSAETRFRLHTTLAEIAARPQTTALLQLVLNQARLLENRRPPRTPQEQAAQFAAYAALLDSLSNRDLPGAQRTLRDIVETDGAVVVSALREADFLMAGS